MSKNNLSEKESWLAAEFALGVLGRKKMLKAEAKYNKEIDFRHTVDGWHNHFEPLLDDVDEVIPNKAVWNKIDSAISGPKQESVGIWKLITAFTSSAAVAAIGALMFITGGDFTGKRLDGLQQELASSQNSLEASSQQLADTKSALSSTADQLTIALDQLSKTNNELTDTKSDLSDTSNKLASSETRFDQTLAELASTRNNLVSAQAEISELRRSIDESQPLVASLTQSGDAPAFVAQYEPLKGALLIRTTLSDETEKVPEIWLIPAGGPREGEVLSLGVMNEDAPDEVTLTDEFIPLVTEGGTLAITMEPPGGAPNGVATGPIIALGKLQALN